MDTKKNNYYVYLYVIFHLSLNNSNNKKPNRTVLCFFFFLFCPSDNHRRIKKKKRPVKKRLWLETQKNSNFSFSLFPPLVSLIDWLMNKFFFWLSEKKKEINLWCGVCRVQVFSFLFFFSSLHNFILKQWLLTTRSLTSRSPLSVVRKSLLLSKKCPVSCISVRSTVLPNLWR